MKERIWFKAKDYGYGWYPVTWQGWVVLLIFFLILVSEIVRLYLTNTMNDLFIWYLPEVCILVGALIFICYLTGEKPEWRWGGKSISKKNKKP